jgi:hypothetical protein
VVSRLAIPPREKRSSIGSTPELLTKPVAIAAKLALMAVATDPSSGWSTKAVTAADWVKGARIPANSADPRIARNGGYFGMANTTSSARGSRLTAEMLNALPSASWAASVLTAPSGSAFKPRNTKMTRLIPSAGPAVQNMSGCAGRW